MPLVNIEESYHRLSQGAFGIGEEHETPIARQWVLQLIDYGAASRIFIELPNTVIYNENLEKAKAKSDEGGSMSEVRALAPCGNLDSQNAISVKDIIAYAYKKNAEIYLADHRKMGYRPDDHPMRHTAISQKFTQITGTTLAVDPGCKGCLLLWGGAHFENQTSIDRTTGVKTTKNTSLENYIVGLPYAMLG